MSYKEYRITDICKFQGGTQPPKSEWSSEQKDGYIRMLQIRDFTQSKSEYIEYVINNSNLKTCNKDDILIGRYGASIGKILTGLSGAYNVAIMKTIPDETIVSKSILYYVLKGSRFQNFIQNIGSRAAQAGFNQNDLSKFYLKLPPIEDQIHIANILSRAEALIAKRKESIQLLDELLKSTFLDMFGDPIRNEKNWEKESLENLTFAISDIDHKMPKSVDEGGYPFISAKDLLDNGSISFDDVKRISEEDFKQLSRKIKPKIGDIVYSRIGAKLGKSRIVKVDFDFLVSYSCCTIKPDTNKINTVFLNHLLDSPFLLKQALKDVRAIGVPDLGMDKIRKFQIILPERKFQTQFAQIVEKVENIKAKYQESLQELENLYASLSQKAFKGELDLSKMEIEEQKLDMAAEGDVKYNE